MPSDLLRFSFALDGSGRRGWSIGGVTRASIMTVTLATPLRRLLSDHQIFCSADCCRDWAFEITEASMSRWLESERADNSGEIAAEIDRVARDAQTAPGRVYLAVPGLESEWDAEQFRAFWEHLRATFWSAAEARWCARD